MSTVGNNNHCLLTVRNKAFAHYAGELGTTVHFTEHANNIYILNSFRHDPSMD